MFLGRSSAFWTVAVVTLLTLPANGQSVISTRSGVVHFFEGAVYLDNQPLEPHPGRFSTVPQGSELHTAEGRAEVLLTPSVFLRMGERSTIRMLANELSNTRVELLAGSAVVDEEEPVSGQSVTLIYKNWSVRFLEAGVYRIDSDPAHLSVLQGKAEVSAAGNEVPATVGQGMDVPFAAVLVPEAFIDPPRDSLSAWAEGRQESISADNAIAANIQDPASMSASDFGFDGFTYFPALGLVSPQPGLSSAYGLFGFYQPGFNSIYLPGYSSLPVFFGLGSVGFPTTYFHPHPMPLHPIPSRHPMPGHPISPVGAHPISPVGMQHSVSSVGIHAGGHH
ncbi:MAG TPA: hypothetical protein VEI52_06405 [Terriglobales bacterium]|nr:hypothetical protein [Terriglobales bacterium]